MYTLIGYTMDCEDFEVVKPSFVEAVCTARKLESQCCLVTVLRDGHPVRWN